LKGVVVDKVLNDSLW